MQKCAFSRLLWAKWLCLLTLALLTVGFLNAQEYRGLILGRVTDPSEAVIPNATITAVGPQQTYTAKTNATGDFTIPFVQPGTYAISAEAPGFKKTTQEGVTITIAQKINLAFTLQVGATSQTVTVTAEAVGVNTADASGGTVMDTTKVQNLPLNGRQMYMLLPMLPGVKFTQQQFGPGGFSGTRGWDENNSYVINGVPGGYNQFNLNGAPITQQTSTGAGSWNIAPNVDAVEEFKVMTNTYDASYGRTGGGTVNTVLKSGTNVFHGTAFDYWRNNVLDANTYTLNQLGKPKPPHNQHQFGGTVGGPVRIPHLYNGKDKTYFFFSFEGWREVMPATTTISVPAANIRPAANAGIDLTPLVVENKLNGIYDPLTTHWEDCAYGTPGSPTDPCTGAYIRDPFPGNIIPANRISPVARKILALFPMPNLGTQQYDNYVNPVPGRYRYNQPIVRIDHNFSDRTRLYGMFAWWSGTEYRNSGGLPDAVSTGDIGSYRSTLTQVLDVTHTFSSTTFLDVRASFNRMLNKSPDGGLAAGLSNLTATELGLTIAHPPTTGHDYAPEIQFDNAYANLIGNQTNPSMFENYDLSPSITKVIGKHNLHFGGQFMAFHNVPCCGIYNAYGTFNFGGGFTQRDPLQYNDDGDTYASFLLGIPYGGSIDTSYSMYEAYRYYGGYLQDDWKVGHRLTLNLGLRWDMETSPVERENRLYAGMCMTCQNPVNALIASNMATMYPNGTLPNGVKIQYPFLGQYQYASSSLSAYQPIHNAFQPKFGFAWGINPKTVLRGGYGLGYSFSIELGGADPWYASTSYQDSPDGGLTPNLYFANGNPFPNGLVPVPGRTLGAMAGVGDPQYFDQRNRPIPYVHQYSLGIQRELPAGVILDASYVGSYTNRLRVGTDHNTLTLDQFNQGRADHNYLQQQVPNPFYGVLSPSTEMGASPTVPAWQLMMPYPQFGSDLYMYTDPVGYANYNSLQVKAEKKMHGGGLLLNGLNFLSSFTWSRNMAATGYLNSYTSLYVDPKPYYAVTGSDRPFDFSLSGVWGLPIGKGGMVAADARGFLGQLINNWSIDWIFTKSSGTPVGLNTSYTYSCNLVPQNQTYTQWLNNQDPSCFTPVPAYTLRTTIPRISYIRMPYPAQLQLAFGKKFALKEGLDLQFKAEAFNATNTPYFGSLNTNPASRLRRISQFTDGEPGSWQGFGTISAQQYNFPRQVQLSLKLQF